MNEHTNTDAELARRRDEARQHLVVDSKNQGDLDLIQDQIRNLRLRGGKLQRAMTKSRPAIMRALESFAKLDCQQFCDTVYRVFPREIRDNIYGFIHEKNEMSVSKTGSESNTAKTYFESSSEAEWRNGTPDTTVRHLWNAEFIGERVFQELIEHYYRSTCFNFGSEFQDILRFQTTDQWQIGAIPADFATNIAVTIKCGGFNFDDLVPAKFPSCCHYRDGWGSIHECNKHNDETLTKTHRVMLLSNLQSLFAFRAGTHIVVTIRVAESDGGYGGFAYVLRYVGETVLPIVFPTLQRLSRSGYAVKFLVDSTYPPFNAVYEPHCPEIAVQTNSSLETLVDEIRKVEAIEACRMEDCYKSLRLDVEKDLPMDFGEGDDEEE